MKRFEALQATADSPSQTASTTISEQVANIQLPQQPIHKSR